MAACPPLLSLCARDISVALSGKVGGVPPAMLPTKVPYWTLKSRVKGSDKRYSDKQGSTVVHTLLYYKCTIVGHMCHIHVEYIRTYVHDPTL